MFSLFIREKVCDHVRFWPDLQILTIIALSSTLAKPVGPFYLASLLVSRAFLRLGILCHIRVRCLDALGIVPWLVSQAFQVPL